MKKYNKYPRVNKNQEYTRDQLLDIMKIDLKKRIDRYSNAIIKLGSSYAEAEECIIKEIIAEVVKSYDYKLISKYEKK